MIMDDYDGQMMFGDLVGLKLPDIHLTDEENPKKIAPRKLVPTGNRTRARYVASARATTFSTGVDVKQGDSLSTILFNNMVLEVVMRKVDINPGGTIYNRMAQIIACADDILIYFFNSLLF